jgi:hypothetical protein
VAKRKTRKSDANHFTASMQTEASKLVNVSLFYESIPACTVPLLHENLISVRGYGLRTYESRQGRNAATVV